MRRSKDRTGRVHGDRRRTDMRDRFDGFSVVLGLLILVALLSGGLG